MIVTLILTATLAWPTPTREMKPWVYNWWMGSAIDEPGIEYQAKELEDKGFGGFHVIPIYGADNVKGVKNRAKWRRLLSPEWVEAWNMAARTARKHDLGIDLTMGSGWCFGGPWVDEAHKSTKGMKVKRAGLGGEGYMIDPFSPEAMKVHVAQFDPIFGKNGKAEKPRAFYHDSYEYYGAMPRPDTDINASQLACFKVWTDWCRENGYLTRNEAHGAPSNWIDFYALADIPETEMFGKDDRNILVSKFASSAAHLKGTKLVSSETCTWIDEHFSERPAEIKMFIDRLFLAGINHIFYHGLCYSPVDAVWPGWVFYASCEMNPRNPIWREMGAVNAYVTRCQSVFQSAEVDNDVLVRWDDGRSRAAVINAEKDPTHINMSIHNARAWFTPMPIGRLANSLWERGYQFDYVSDRFLKKLRAAGDVGPYLGRYVDVLDPIAKEAWPKKAVPAPFSVKANGLMCTRYKYQGGKLYFVVNQSGKDRVIYADTAFTVMDPMTGRIYETKDVTLPDWGSVFLAASAEATARQGLFKVALVSEWQKTHPPKAKRVLSSAAWTVKPLAGGPTLPTEVVNALGDWSKTWPYFSGTARYTTTFKGKEGELLDLGEVKEIARVRINGKDLGVRFMRPYHFAIPAGLLKDENTLEVEVTNLGANRLRWNDLNHVDWKYFCNKPKVAAVDYKPLDASKWKIKESGLFGPVEIK